MTSSDDDLVVVSMKEEPLSEKALQMKLLKNLVSLEEPCPFFKGAFESFVVRKFKSYYPPEVVSAVYKRIHQARTSQPARLYNPIKAPSIVISDSDDSSSESSKGVKNKNFVDLTSVEDIEPRPSTSSTVENQTAESNLQIQVTNSRIDSVHVTVNNIQTEIISGTRKRRKSEPVKKTVTCTKKEADYIRTRLLLSKIVELSVQSEEQNERKKRRSKSHRRSWH